MVSDCDNNVIQQIAFLKLILSIVVITNNIIIIYAWSRRHMVSPTTAFFIAISVCQILSFLRCFQDTFARSTIDSSLWLLGNSFFRAEVCLIAIAGIVRFFVGGKIIGWLRWRWTLTYSRIAIVVSIIVVIVSFVPLIIASKVGAFTYTQEMQIYTAVSMIVRAYIFIPLIISCVVVVLLAVLYYKQRQRHLTLEQPDEATTTQKSVEDRKEPESLVQQPEASSSHDVQQPGASSSHDQDLEQQEIGEASHQKDEPKVQESSKRDDASHAPEVIPVGFQGDGKKSTHLTLLVLIFNIVAVIEGLATAVTSASNVFKDQSCAFLLSISLEFLFVFLRAAIIVLYCCLIDDFHKIFKSFMRSPVWRFITCGACAQRQYPMQYISEKIPDEDIAILARVFIRKQATERT